MKSSRGAFIKAAENSTNPGSLKAGFYVMNQHMQASLAYAYLVNPKNLVQRGITLPEGLRVSGHAAAAQQGERHPGKRASRPC